MAAGQVLEGDIRVTGSMQVEGAIRGDGSEQLFGKVYHQAQSVDPGDPQPGYSVTWLSDGTDSGDAGDFMIKINIGGTVKTGTLVDYSTL